MDITAVMIFERLLWTQRSLPCYRGRATGTCSEAMESNLRQKTKLKLRGLSPRANYTDRATSFLFL
jgi:hypothetical protein